MNSFRPVPSSIEGVKFSRLSSEDISQLSVRRIANPTTFDSLLNPIPGGLYDPALGAVLNNSCSTCHLDEQACPGHCGHIELPVFVYHSSFMTQAFRLLRAQCMFCNRLKMSRPEVNRFCCQLKLISFGLLKQAKEVVELDQISIEENDGSDIQAHDTNLDDNEVENIIIRRLNFVKTCLREHKKSKRDKALAASDEAILAAWKATILEFNREIVKGRQCRNCKGISHGYRKNRSSSIFSKALSDKDQARNAQSSLKAPKNSLLVLNRVKERKNRASKQDIPRASRKQFDEGVADLDTTSNEDGLETEIADGSGFDNLSENEEENEDVSLIGVQSPKELSRLFPEARIQKSGKSREKDNTADKETYISSNEVHASLTTLFKLEPEIMSLIYPSSPFGEDSRPPSADMFFVRHLLVPPNKFRKEIKTGFGLVVEPPDHSVYKSILSACANVWQIQRELLGEAGASEIGRIRNFDDLQRACVELQECVNTLFDSSTGPTARSRRVPDGIKQKLERKEGLFRMFIMGKRVNFAARTVISPDPNIEADEIGVPPIFARTLTYPEPVTSHSFEELKQAVKNGPNKWPGATAVEYENGQVMSLRNKTDEDRLSIANLLLAPSNSNMTGVRNKKVHRHLNNGDIVIMNRQPTLHKPSMMCHRAKVLPQEKTLRMHYANCNTYNADFDGDEMNLHFPQNESARAEALQIADTNHQYLSATAGKPLRGLIQDHISMGVWLTCKDTFFTREEYQQLLYSCLRPENGHLRTERILLLPPTTFKPKQFWTGKQVISTILENLRPSSGAPLDMSSKCSTTDDKWQERTEEGVLRVENGELITGVLDKKQIGPSSGGLIHSIYEIHGPTVVSKFIGTLGRLLTRLLNMRAFSCGVEDLLLTSEGEATRAEQLKDADSIGPFVASQYVSLENSASQSKELLNRLETILRDNKKQTGLDVLMNSATSALTTEVSRRCLPHGLMKIFPHNQMQTMTISGAKGSMVNANQITCNLGQQVLEGRRVPTMVSGKTLPSFKALEPSVRAGGYISDRFLTGIKPQEFFFHAMAGREGLIDTAVKTAGSGYLQRCLVKGLEGARVEYDTTVRDSDGSIIQSLYGEDGLEVVKQQLLLDFDFLARNFKSLHALLNVHASEGRTGNEAAMSWNRKAIYVTNVSGNIAAKDPALLRFPPASSPGSVSEKFFTAAKNYVTENPLGRIRTKTENKPRSVNRKDFDEMLRLYYLKGVVSPGEAVGVVAAQSIGEPSTQMTLNTFHLAGHAAKNVTLGVPRLREILMTASKVIKTPTMSLYPIAEMSEDDCQKFAKSLNRLPLSELIDSVQVNERIGQGVGSNARIYEISLKFYSSEEYTREHAIGIAQVIQKLELTFLPRLQRLIKAEIKRRKKYLQKSASKVDALPDVGESYGKLREQVPTTESQSGEGDSDASEDGDDDAEMAKRKANLDEGLTYEDPDEEDNEIIRQAEVEDEHEIESEPEDEGYGGSERFSSDSEEESELNRSRKEKAKDREARLKQSIAELTSFYFDDSTGETCKMTLEFSPEDPKILLLDLVSSAARETLIQEVKGIRSCMVTVDSDKNPIILTEGVNLDAMQTYQDMIIPNRTYTNDIFAMSERYGVEAARSLIIKELWSVFQGHTIAVDHRHLTLLADYMTRDGGFLPFSRTGMKDKHSPFAKMSFETTMGFLRDAVLDGEVDGLVSPSARITLGKVGRMGTGMCDVFLDSPGEQPTASHK